MGDSGSESRLQKLKPALGPSLLSAVLLIGPCQASLGQGDADLEAPGLAPFPTTLATGATLFQNVRIFDGKSAALSPPALFEFSAGRTDRSAASRSLTEQHAALRFIVT